MPPINCLACLYSNGACLLRSAPEGVTPVCHTFSPPGPQLVQDSGYPSKVNPGPGCLTCYGKTGQLPNIGVCCGNDSQFDSTCGNASYCASRGQSHHSTFTGIPGISGCPACLATSETQYCNFPRGFGGNCFFSGCCSTLGGCLENKEGFYECRAFGNTSIGGPCSERVACCLGGACTVTSFNHCISVGGCPTGKCNCSPDSCVPKACCIGSQCLNLTNCECTSRNGTILEGRCEDSACGNPCIKVCCKPSGFCYNTPPIECRRDCELVLDTIVCGQPGTDNCCRTPDQCPEYPCCFSSFPVYGGCFCQKLTPFACMAAGGHVRSDVPECHFDIVGNRFCIDGCNRGFSQLTSICDSACCLDRTGKCEILPSFLCQGASTLEGVGGAVLGTPICGDVCLDCKRACCFDDKPCDILEIEDCKRLGGVSLPLNHCFPDPCRRACCIPVPNSGGRFRCETLTVAECEELDGTRSVQQEPCEAFPDGSACEGQCCLCDRVFQADPKECKAVGGEFVPIIINGQFTGDPRQFCLSLNVRPPCVSGIFDTAFDGQYGHPSSRFLEQMDGAECDRFSGDGYIGSDGYFEEYVCARPVTLPELSRCSTYFEGLTGMASTRCDYTPNCGDGLN